MREREREEEETKGWTNVKSCVLVVKRLFNLFIFFFF